MKGSFGKHSHLAVLASITLFICGILTLWTMASTLLVDIGILSWVVDLFVAGFFILSGYLILQEDHIETGAFMALISGLTLALWSYFNNVIGLKLLFQGLIPLIAGVVALRAEKKAKKTVLMRRIRGFWEEFSHNKIGLTGLAMILLYVAVAFLQPLLITHDPEMPVHADDDAMPEWVCWLVPAWRNLPRTIDYSLEWKENNLTGVTIEQRNEEWLIQYAGNETVVACLEARYNYPYDLPRSFSLKFRWNATPGVGRKLRYSLELNLTDPDGNVYPLWDQHWWRFKTAACTIKNPDYNPMYDPISKRFYPGFLQYWQHSYSEVYKEWGYEIPTWDKTQTYTTVEITMFKEPAERLGFSGDEMDKMVNTLFSPPGNYTLQLYVTFKPTEPNATCQIAVTKIELDVPGIVWGLLGTEFMGRDCWSRLISGVRISLAVGIACSIIQVAIGVLVGVVAGYYGGAVDEVLMRLVDVLICLPFLPILIVLVTILGRSILYIILLIAIFGWLGLARLVRSGVLSVKEMPFIESAKASGASRTYIIFRHIIPNLMPIVISTMVLAIPGAILTEAALSFIGFGDSRVPTWGREFAFMTHEGANPYKAWWWLLPPGIAMTLLCVAFVFIGHAVDEIVNPRLRRRR